jgi:hypothetical protein
VAVAAALLLAVYAWRDGNRAQRGAPRGYSVPVSASAVLPELTVMVTPAVALSRELPVRAQPDEVAAKCDDECVVMAVYRECSETCECRDWQVHEWNEEGQQLVDLDPEELVDIALDVTGNPAVGQIMVLASPGRKSDASERPVDAGEVLACLANMESPTCDDGELSAYAMAVKECLPASVTVVERNFYVK